jgi:hypothetical protein
MRANVCVCVSLEWLATKLCQIHDRLSVDQQYLLAINTELVHLIETDLNSETTHCSLLESLHCAIDTVQSPYMIIDGTGCRQANGVSKSQTPTLPHSTSRMVAGRLRSGSLL